MHIPACDTAQQDILSFSLALEKALLPQADYDVADLRGHQPLHRRPQ